ncbi:MAG: hypothetical protein ACT4P6_16510 [Gemmatimonadaceae bacterium]
MSTVNRSGVANSALLFDGIDDRIDLGDRSNTLAVPFSIAMWVFRPAGGATEFRSMVHTSFPARIGSLSLITSNRPWLGSLDGVRLYDCSLESRDVPALMNVP